MEPIKLKPEELSKLQDIRKQYYEISLGLGKLAIQKSETKDALLELENNETELFVKLAEVKGVETNAIKELFKTYGEGNLNLDLGTFTKNN